MLLCTAPSRSRPSRAEQQQSETERRTGRGNRRVTRRSVYVETVGDHPAARGTLVEGRSASGVDLRARRTVGSRKKKDAEVDDDGIRWIGVAEAIEQQLDVNSLSFSSREIKRHRSLFLVSDQ